MLIPQSSTFPRPFSFNPASVPTFTSFAYTVFKADGTSQGGTGAVTQAGGGSNVWRVALQPSETNVLGSLAIGLIATGAVPPVEVDITEDQVVSAAVLTPPPTASPGENETQLIPQNSAYNRVFFAGATGLSFTAFLSKNGGPFTGAQGTVSQIGNGFYNLALTATDTNTLGPLAIMLVPNAGTTLNIIDQVTALGVNAATQPIAIQRGVAIAAYPFPMYTNAAPPVLLTGLAVSAQRSLDGGAFVALAGPVTEIGFGWYSIPLSAADTNGAMIALRFSAAGAQDTLVTVATQVG